MSWRTPKLSPTLKVRVILSHLAFSGMHVCSPSAHASVDLLPLSHAVKKYKKQAEKRREQKKKARGFVTWASIPDGKAKAAGRKRASIRQMLGLWKDSVGSIEDALGIVVPTTSGGKRKFAPTTPKTVYSQVRVCPL